MHHRPRTRLAAQLTTALLGSLSAAVLAASATAQSTTTTATTGTATIATAATPTPHLGVSWTKLDYRCKTVTERVRVRVHRTVIVHHKRHVETVVKVERRRVRKCGLHPVRTSSHVHLAWKQQGRAYGHLTLAGQPIANAPITVTDTPAGGTAVTGTVTTDAHGRFTLPLAGPDSALTLSYTPTPGTVYATSAIITERAYLSLHVGHLAAGHRGHFYGIVFGGHIPENLYVQFFYLSATAGWQPFAGLAGVGQHTGHWQAHITIPAAAAGYRYDVKAMVVPSRYWPFATTQSKVVSRIVS